MTRFDVFCNPDGYHELYKEGEKERYEKDGDEELLANVLIDEICQTWWDECGGPDIPIGTWGLVDISISAAE